MEVEQREPQMQPQMPMGMAGYAVDDGSWWVGQRGNQTGMGLEGSEWCSPRRRKRRHSPRLLDIRDPSQSHTRHRAATVFYGIQVELRLQKHLILQDLLLRCPIRCPVVPLFHVRMDWKSVSKLSL